MRRLFFFLLMGAWLGLAIPARAQTPEAVPFAVRFLIIDANGQALPALGLEFLVFEYGASTELWAAGSCVTDGQGMCLITATLPPSLAPDWYEGVVYVSTLGRQRVGWQGQEALLTVQLAPDGNLPTEEAFLHPPYDTQSDSPTDTPLNWLPPSTETPLPPTALGTASPVPSITTALTLTLTARPFYTTASSEREGGLWFWFLGGSFILLCGLFLWSTYGKK